MPNRLIFRISYLGIFMLVGFVYPRDAYLQASSGIHRCDDGRGNVLYTDKVCSDLNMLEKPKTQISNSVSGGTSRYIRSCARTEDDLLWEARGAFETGDINRAAGLFLWNGSSRESSNKRLDQLGKINYRSLISVDLMYPESQATQVQFDEDGNIIEAQQAKAPTPYGIRVDFYVDKKNTQVSSMRFGLQRAVSCWWLQF
jgi:hypothetical protein